MASPIWQPHQRMYFNARLADGGIFGVPRSILPYSPDVEHAEGVDFLWGGGGAAQPHDAPWRDDYSAANNRAEAMCWNGPNRHVYVVVDNPSTGKIDLLRCDEYFTDYEVVKQDVTAHLPSSNFEVYEVMAIHSVVLENGDYGLVWRAETVSAGTPNLFHRVWWTDFAGNVIANPSMSFVRRSPVTVSSDNATVLYSCMGDGTNCTSEDAQEAFTGMFIVRRQELRDDDDANVITRRLYRVSHLAAGTATDGSEAFDAVERVVNYNAFGPPDPLNPTGNILNGKIYFHPGFDFINGALLIPVLDYVGTNQWRWFIRRFTRLPGEQKWTDEKTTYDDIAITTISSALIDPELDLHVPRVRPALAWTSEPDQRLYVHVVQYGPNSQVDPDDSDVGLFAYDLEGFNATRVADDWLNVGWGNFNFELGEPQISTGPGTRGAWEL